MIKDYKNGEEKTKVYYRLVFDDGHNNGFAFDCDENGNVIIAEDNDGAKENYRYCLANEDKFVRFNKVVKEEYTYRENNSGTCNCGKRIELYNEYLGGCECPYCGQWWNIWGQELNPVNTWDEGDDW